MKGNKQAGAAVEKRPQDGQRGGMGAAMKAAFPHTIPVLTGYVFMGMAFGILLASKGFGPIWAFCMSVFIYAGSMQFVAVGLMAAGFAPLSAFAMTLMVNARHVFYGIPMLDRFKTFGKAKYYMVFALTDETFALLNSAKPPKGVDEKKFYLAISFMDHSYWITGCTLGGIIGSALPINTQGIDFVMTALFVVIFIEQWQQMTSLAKKQAEKQGKKAGVKLLLSSHLPALIGMAASLVCRLVFGPQWFILAAMAVLVVVFTLCRKPLEREVAI